MATCPCGCGQPIGFMKKRLAQHAVDCRTGVKVLDAAIGAQLPTFNSETLDQLRRRGSSMSNAILAEAHGRSAGPVPSLHELNSWRQGVNLVAQQLQRDAPQSFGRLLASLDPQAQRLVRSMVHA